MTVEGPSSPDPAGDAPRQDGRSDAALLEDLYRLGGSELACLCSLALRASELCGGRAIRVEPTPDRAPGDGDGEDPRRDPCKEADPDGARVPVRGPGASGRAEAWLAVAPGGDGGAPAGIDDLGPLAACAGLVLECHRLAREARRSRLAARRTWSTLAHGIRSHLQSAFLRADTLILSLGEGDPDADEMMDDLERLKGTVQTMAEEIRVLLEAPGPDARPPEEGASAPEEAVRIPELLREAAGAEDAGPPRVEVEGDIPLLRADRRRLGAALGELVDVARRSRGTPSLTVRPDADGSGTRVILGVDLPRPDARAAAPPSSGALAPGSASPAVADRSGGDGESEDAPLPSLRDLLEELGGRLRVEARGGDDVEVTVVLPARDGRTGGEPAKDV